MRPRTLLAIIAAVLALVLPLVLPVFQVTLLTNIAIVSITVIGLVLLTGISGLTSFGQAAFMGNPPKEKVSARTRRTPQQIELNERMLAKA